MPETISDILGEFYPDEELVRYPEFDACILGVVEGFGGVSAIVYDKEAVLKQLTEGDNPLTEEDAIEHFYFNIIGGYHGTTTPVFLNRIPGVPTPE